MGALFQGAQRTIKLLALEGDTFRGFIRPRLAKLLIYVISQLLNDGMSTRIDTPAPQRKIASPSITARMRSSGMSAPSSRNRMAETDVAPAEENPHHSLIPPPRPDA